MLTSRIQHTYLSPGRFVIAMLAFGCASLSAASPFEELKTKLDQALEENSRKVATDQKIATIDKLYKDRLAALRTDFVVQGNLDGVLEVQEEISRFENSGDATDEFSEVEQLARYQKIYANEIKRIQSEELVGAVHTYKAYEEALLEREQELVRIGYIDQAIKVREERDRVSKLIKKASRGRVDPASIRPEDVFARPGDTEAAAGPDQNQQAARDGAGLSNEALETLKAGFNQSLAVHWEKVASAEQEMYEQYMKELQVRKFHYQSEGSLDGVLALQDEMKRFEETGAISNNHSGLKHLDIVQRNFARDLQALKSDDRERLLAVFRQYLDGLRELEESLVRRDLIIQAVAVRKERERVAEIVKRRAQKDLMLNLFEISREAGE